MCRFLVVLLLLIPSTLLADPNLQSYKSSGECSPLEKGSDCFYCPEQKKFIALGTNSEDATPKDSDYEFVDPAAPSSEVDGTR